MSSMQQTIAAPAPRVVRPRPGARITTLLRAWSQRERLGQGDTLPRLRW
jgi:hypothetical protein